MLKIDFKELEIDFAELEIDFEELKIDLQAKISFYSKANSRKYFDFIKCSIIALY